MSSSDHLPDGPARRLAESDQTLAERDQTLAERDQTLAESDQTSADSDQTSAERDQVAADRDQAASDRDLEAGADRAVHDATRDIRARTTRQREHTAWARLDAAEKRDAAAQARDLAALARDQAAEARSLSIAQRDAACDQDDGVRSLAGDEAVRRAAAQRDRAAEDRAQAAAQRALAAQDRQASAEDREHAARERLRSLEDRQALAYQIAIAETDPLTGARTRAAGLIDLDRELERCRRTGGRVIVAYVDVVGLKALNDSEGHGAGDDLLKRVVQLTRSHLRPYDLIIRLGGDEFLFAMSNMTLADARQRFRAIAAALAEAPRASAISTGFAELSPDDTLTKLIARADRELLDSRRANQASRSVA